MSATANPLDRYEIWVDRTPYNTGCDLVHTFDNETDALAFVVPEATYEGAQVWRIHTTSITILGNAVSVLTTTQIA